MDPEFGDLPTESPYRKKKIPKALSEQVWITHMGHVFEGKCRVRWCRNRINAFDYECGHNIPESRGGKTSIDNLIPICARCNRSMGDRFSIDEWNARFGPPTHWMRRFACVLPMAR
jgi:5-methylcytosine-specific restriction endonuclease McrA